MNDSEILDEVYRRLRVMRKLQGLTELSDTIEYIEKEWQKADDAAVYVEPTDPNQPFWLDRRYITRPYLINIWTYPNYVRERIF